MTGKERRESSSSESDVSSSDEEEDTKPSNDVVMTKYMMGAEIVNVVLKDLIAAAKTDVTVRSLCELGDKRLAELLGNTFKAQKDFQKGISMPTCVSIDNCVCHFSPLASEPEVLLKNGQVVKFDVGVHLDGYIAGGAHTIVVGASKENPATDKKAKVIMAAYNTMGLILRMLRPDKGFKNTDITEYISQLCRIYEVTPVENMLSHQVERFKISGDKQIIQNPSDEQKPKIEKCTFENYEVYAIDVLVSTGEGKSKTLDTRTTVYKRTDDFVYQLKMKASRIFFSEAEKKFGGMPFSLRLFENETRAKMGVVECERHGLLTPYQVLYEREGEFVAQFKTTAIIMPNGIHKITGLPLDMSALDCNVKITDQKLSSLLQEGLKPKKKKLAKKATVAAAAEKKPVEAEMKSADKKEKQKTNA